MLDAMDAAWTELTAEERATLNAEPASTWPDVGPPPNAATLATVLGAHADGRALDVSLAHDGGVDTVARAGGHAFELSLRLGNLSGGRSLEVVHRVPVQSTTRGSSIDSRRAHVTASVSLAEPIDAGSSLRVGVSVVATAGGDQVEIGEPSEAVVAAPAAA